MSRALLIAEAFVLGAILGVVIGCACAQPSDALTECRLQLAGYESPARHPPKPQPSICPGPFSGCAGAALVIPRDDCPDDPDDECQYAESGR